MGADGLDSRAGDGQVNELVVGPEGDGDSGGRGPSQNCLPSTPRFPEPGTRGRTPPAHPDTLAGGAPASSRIVSTGVSAAPAVAGPGQLRQRTRGAPAAAAAAVARRPSGMQAGGEPINRGGHVQGRTVDTVRGARSPAAGAGQRAPHRRRFTAAVPSPGLSGMPRSAGSRRRWRLRPHG